ncbi:MAG: hypothetical protein HZA77_09225 [Candidatus Schekmanbacteria bacterium]|nr:hypothetical protein [Candidatus Schekmanbacteria bacterium]
MESKLLKDRIGRVIGKIEQQSPTRLIIRDAHWTIKGWYEIDKNTTRDSRGKLIGTGNLLTMLL